MTLSIDRVYGTPSGPRAEIVPSVSFGFYNDTVAAGGTDFIKHSTNTDPVSDDWIIGSRSWVTWQLSTGIAAGASLQVYLTSDDLGIYDLWNTYPLLGLATTWQSGLYLPGWKARFRLVNASGVLGNLIGGMVKVQAVF